MRISPRAASGRTRMRRASAAAELFPVDRLHVERMLWRRRKVPHHYSGSLSAGDASLRLDGQDPATGIAVSLSVPYAEIERVRMPTGPAEHVAGERGVVIELVDAEAICLAEVGAAPSRARWLAAQLAKLCGGGPATPRHVKGSRREPRR